MLSIYALLALLLQFINLIKALANIGSQRGLIANTFITVWQYKGKKRIAVIGPIRGNDNINNPNKITWSHSPLYHFTIDVSSTVCEFYSIISLPGRSSPSLRHSKTGFRITEAIFYFGFSDFSKFCSIRRVRRSTLFLYGYNFSDYNPVQRSVCPSSVRRS